MTQAQVSSAWYWNISWREKRAGKEP